jgi:hypothetical protein
VCTENYVRLCESLAAGVMSDCAEMLGAYSTVWGESDDDEGHKVGSFGSVELYLAEPVRHLRA